MDWSHVVFGIITGGLGFLIGKFIEHKSQETLQVQNGRIQQQLDGLRNKLRLYQEIVGPVIAIVNRLETMDNSEPPGDPYALMEEYYSLRLETLSQLSLFAPKAVIKAVGSLLQYLFLVIRMDKPYSLEEVTREAVRALNSIREDVGLAEGSISIEDFWIPDSP